MKADAAHHSAVGGSVRRICLPLLILTAALSAFLGGQAFAHNVGAAEDAYYVVDVSGPNDYRCASSWNRLADGINVEYGSGSASYAQLFCSEDFVQDPGEIRLYSELWKGTTPVLCRTWSLRSNSGSTSSFTTLANGADCGHANYRTYSEHQVWVMGAYRFDARTSAYHTLG